MSSGIVTLLILQASVINHVKLILSESLYYASAERAGVQRWALGRQGAYRAAAAGGA